MTACGCLIAMHLAWGPLPMVRAVTHAVWIFSSGAHTPVLIRSWHLGQQSQFTVTVCFLWPSTAALTLWGAESWGDLWLQPLVFAPRVYLSVWWPWQTSSQWNLANGKSLCTPHAGPKLGHSELIWNGTESWAWWAYLESHLLGRLRWEGCLRRPGQQCNLISK